MSVILQDKSRPVLGIKTLGCLNKLLPPSLVKCRQTIIHVCNASIKTRKHPYMQFCSPHMARSPLTAWLTGCLWWPSPYPFTWVPLHVSPLRHLSISSSSDGTAALALSGEADNTMAVVTTYDKVALSA